jgi:YfiH family protein
LISYKGDVKIFQFESFPKEVLQLFFSRQGGYSPEPWKSLNMGKTVGDDAIRVEKNKKKAFDAVGINKDSIFDVWQVHGNRVVIAETPLSKDQLHERADAILTSKQGIYLMMRFADCVPILLYDPVKKVIGIIHAGWIGTVKGIVRTTIDALIENFGSNPIDVIAGIGPSIGPDHYEVNADVVELVKSSFPKNADTLLIQNNGGVNFDLWGANLFLLNESGVKQVEVAHVCTACNLQDWYSYRAEKGKTGRFGAIIGLV